MPYGSGAVLHCVRMARLEQTKLSGAPDGPIVARTSPSGARGMSAVRVLVLYTTAGKRLRACMGKDGTGSGGLVWAGYQSHNLQCGRTCLPMAMKWSCQATVSATRSVEINVSDYKFGFVKMITTCGQAFAYEKGLKYHMRCGRCTAVTMISRLFDTIQEDCPDLVTAGDVVSITTMSQLERIAPSIGAILEARKPTGMLELLTTVKGPMLLKSLVAIYVIVLGRTLEKHINLTAYARALFRDQQLGHLWLPCVARTSRARGRASRACMHVS